VGYSFYYHYSIVQSDEKIVQKIDGNNYNENELTEIKVPLNLPYYNNNNLYERVDGTVEINGTYYNYVKKKINNDTLYLLCLSNLVKTQLYKDKNSYSSHVNDMPVNKKNNTGLKKNGFSNEYVEYFTQYSITAPLIIVNSGYNSPLYLLSPGNYNMQGQPPEFTIA
jgi:hypothetical protein